MEGDGGYIKMFAYWKPFEAHLVERILQDYSKAIIDFGAGHSVHEDPILFNRVKKAFAACTHVILILPSDDQKQSLFLLNSRLEKLLLREIGHVPPETLVTNKHFLEHPSNHELASSIFYSEGKTPQDLAIEIIARLEIKKLR